MSHFTVIYDACVLYSTFKLAGQRSASILTQSDQLSWLYELCREQPHVIRTIEALQAEFTVMRQRVDEVSSRCHTESIDINIDYRVGGNSSQHSPQVIQWLVLAFPA